MGLVYSVIGETVLYRFMQGVPLSMALLKDGISSAILMITSPLFFAKNMKL
jgi:hypothetical protein